jgi:hypothetical protein
MVLGESDLSDSGCGPVASFCEHGYELLSSLKAKKEFFTI